MHRAMCRVTRVAAAFFVADACTPTLPSAPSDLTEGVIIYEHANYLGASAHVLFNIDNLEKFKGPCRKTVDSGDGNSSTVETWDDCISSIRVAPGWRATLYEHRDFKGWAADIGEENAPNYQLVPGPCSKGTFNDCASSIRVFRKMVLP